MPRRAISVTETISDYFISVSLEEAHEMRDKIAMILKIRERVSGNGQALAQQPKRGPGRPRGGSNNQKANSGHVAALDAPNAATGLATNNAALAIGDGHQ
jgi:hypothetical protein